MRESFVPEEFVAPQRVEFNQYYLVPISTKDVDEDLHALLTNADTIVQVRGGGSEQGWPHVFTRDENFKDLAWLETCAKLGQLFSYILRSKADDSYAGCIYIYPIELFHSEQAEKYDVDFSFWITKKEYDGGNYEKIFQDLFDWLKKDWPFAPDRIYLRNKEIPEKLKNFKSKFSI